MWDEESPQNYEPKEGCLYGRYCNSPTRNRQVFYEYGFGEKMSSVPQKRLAEIIFSLAMKGNQSKTTDFVELGQGYRTTYGHFLFKGKWDEQAISQKQQEKSFQKAAELALAKHAPLYLSIDDTVIRLLAKIGGSIKIADTSNQGESESKAFSTIAVTI